MKYDQIIIIRNKSILNYIHSFFLFSHVIIVFYVFFKYFSTLEKWVENYEFSLLRFHNAMSSNVATPKQRVITNMISTPMMIQPQSGTSCHVKSPEVLYTGRSK